MFWIIKEKKICLLLLLYPRLTPFFCSIYCQVYPDPLVALSVPLSTHSIWFTFHSFCLSNALCPAMSWKLNALWLPYLLRSLSTSSSQHSACPIYWALWLPHLLCTLVGPFSMHSDCPIYWALWLPHLLCTLVAPSSMNFICLIFHALWLPHLPCTLTVPSSEHPVCSIFHAFWPIFCALCLHHIPSTLFTPSFGQTLSCHPHHQSILSWRAMILGEYCLFVTAVK